MADDTVLPVFVDKSNIENIAKYTGTEIQKTEISTEQLVHDADKDKV